MSTKIQKPVKKTVHLLGYFVSTPPASEFMDWLVFMQEARRDRNRRLRGETTIDGNRCNPRRGARVGRSLAGRPHFARIMVQKGYVASRTKRSERYLDESAPGYVEREEPSLAEGIERIRLAGGISSLAHPSVWGNATLVEEEELISGFIALDSIRSKPIIPITDRRTFDVTLDTPEKYNLRVTGGSDFHGDNKPSVKLGSG